jgi:hypothetical protein
MKRERPWVPGIVFAILIAMVPVRAVAAETRSSSGSLPATGELALRNTASLANPEPRDVSRSYADREARAPQSSEFRGGDGMGIYIGSGAALVLAVVLLVLLLR